MRADLYLVERGFASSRNRAQELIASGRVFLISRTGRTEVKKPSANIADADKIEIAVDPAGVDFVSRGGVKMAGALAHTRLDVNGFRILDIGISTGGFTDCLLQKGAKSSVGVDVGHGQLHDRLQKDPRVVLCEGVNARNLEQANLVQLNSGEKFDLAVIDVSFISLTLVLPETIQYLKEAGSVLALVKPQFEVGREGLGKNGIVKDEALFQEVETKIRRSCTGAGLVVEDYFESSIAGTDGNREFFVWTRSPELSFGLFSSPDAVSSIKPPHRV